MEDREHIPQHRDKSHQNKKNGRNFWRAICNITSQGERMGRRVAKKHRVKWTDRQELYEINYGAGQYWLKNWSKLWAQRQPKNVPLAVLVSNAAGSSIAVSNDNDVRFIHLSEAEVTEASDLFSVCAWFFPAWFWTQPKLRFSSEVEKIDRPSWFFHYRLIKSCSSTVLFHFRFFNFTDLCIFCITMCAATLRAIFHRKYCVTFLQHELRNTSICSLWLMIA